MRLGDATRTSAVTSGIISSFMNTNVAGVLFIAFTTLLQHFSLLIVTTILMLWSFGGFAKFPLTFYPTGRCNRSASGYDGPWTPTPTTFNNAYFTILSNLKWVPKEWDGPYQYVDASTGRLMMLPTDLVLCRMRNSSDGWMSMPRMDKNLTKTSPRHFKSWRS